MAEKTAEGNLPGIKFAFGKKSFFFVTEKTLGAAQTSPPLIMWWGPGDMWWMHRNNTTLNFSVTKKRDTKRCIYVEYIVDTFWFSDPPVPVAGTTDVPGNY